MAPTAPMVLTGDAEANVTETFAFGNQRDGSLSLAQFAIGEGAMAG